eukprot:m.671781 g.671781  ORF g.671781 m.671781 type:complete len:304 (-) comp22776_c1_seq7:1861-2772(-)
MQWVTQRHHASGVRPVCVRWLAPQGELVILAHREEPSTVGMPRHGHHRCRVPIAQYFLQCPGVTVPDEHPAIHAACGQVVPVRAEARLAPSRSHVESIGTQRLWCRSAMHVCTMLLLDPTQKVPSWGTQSCNRALFHNHSADLSQLCCHTTMCNVQHPESQQTLLSLNKLVEMKLSNEARGTHKHDTDCIVSHTQTEPHIRSLPCGVYARSHVTGASTSHVGTQKRALKDTAACADPTPRPTRMCVRVRTSCRRIEWSRARVATTSPLGLHAMCVMVALCSVAMLNAVFLMSTRGSRTLSVLS